MGKKTKAVSDAVSDWKGVLAVLASNIADAIAQRISKGGNQGKATK